MKIKSIISFVLILTMLFSLYACSPQKPDASQDGTDKQTVADMIGRQVSVNCNSYKRVVCIGAGALRLYSYICDMSLLCGVEDIDNISLSQRPKMFDDIARPYVIAYGDIFSSLPSCGVGGPNAQTAESEKILSCNPDIVISEYEDAEKADALQQQLGIPVITLRTGKDGVFDECFKGSIRLLSKIFGNEKRAEELIDFIDSQTDEISKRSLKAVQNETPFVYICGLGNRGTTNHLMTAQDYAAFSIANVNNVVSGLEATGIQAIEEEKFVQLGSNTDIMIIDSAAVKNIASLYRQDNTIFNSCKAWQNGEVYLQMAYNAYYTNYEMALINAWFIAKTVHPDLFKDIDMTEKTDEITKMFLNKELSKEIFACEASFGGYQKIDVTAFFN